MKWKRGIIVGEDNAEMINMYINKIVKILQQKRILRKALFDSITETWDKY